jgi:hypothetical protein
VTVLVVDVANVMGSRPDGWWRDRAGAATRLMDSLVPLVGTEVAAPDSSGSPAGSTAGSTLRIDRVVAVVEGQARTAKAPAGIDMVIAPADGDTTIAMSAGDVIAEGGVPLVVTADRGLRERLPTGSRTAGPSWLLGLLSR